MVLAGMLASGLNLETPARILERIQQAQAEDSGDFSLPAIPDVSNEDASSSARGRSPASRGGRGPADAYDVGLKQVEETPAQNLPGRILKGLQQGMGGGTGVRKPFLRSALAEKPSDPPAATSPAPQSASQDRYSTASPYTSTPATYLQHTSHTAFSGGGATARSRLAHELSLSEAGSDIDKDDHLDDLDRDEMVVVSASGSGTESDSKHNTSGVSRGSRGRGRKSYGALSGVIEERTEDLSHGEDPPGADNYSYSRVRPSPPKGSLGDLDLDELDDSASDLDPEVLDHGYSPSRPARSPPPQQHASPLARTARSPTPPSSEDPDPTAQIGQVFEHRKMRQSQASSQPDGAESYFTSPGVVRRDSPKAGNSISIERSEREGAPDDSSFLGPSNNRSDSFRHKFTTPKPQMLDSASGSSEAEDRSDTPELGAKENKAAAERRKALLLSTLRLTAVRSAARTRLARGTPFARWSRTPAKGLSAARAGLSGMDLGVSLRSEEDAENASYASDSTQHDLTTYAANARGAPHRHWNGNTSIPEAGTATGEVAAAGRFNGQKLNAYLHALNTHLTEENQGLIKTLEGTHREVERLKAELGRAGDEGEGVERSANGSKELQGQLEGLLQSHKGVVALQEQVLRAGGKIAGAGSANEAVLEDQLKRVREQLEAKNTETENLRQQLFDARSAAATGDGVQQWVDELQKEVMNLRNELNAVDKERDGRAEEVAQLRMEVVEASGRHATSAMELQSRVEELEKALSEARQTAQGAEEKRVLQEQEFGEKMSTLKEGLCQVMQEQDGKLEDALKEADELRGRQAKQAEEEKINRVESDRQLKEAREALEVAQAEKEELQKALTLRTGDQAAERRIDLLQEEVSRLEATISNKEQQLRDAAFEASLRVDQHANEISELKAAIQAAKDEATEANQQAADSKATLAQFEEALDESEKQLITFEEEVAGLKAELDVAQSTVTAQKANIAGLEQRLSQAIKSALSASTAPSLSRTPAQTPRSRGQNGHGSATPAHADTVASLEEELDEAYREIGRLKARLATTPDAAASSEIQELRIKTLESHKTELEDRVTTLRQQALVATPGKSAGQSLLFKSLLHLKTPKTPGAMLANMTPYSPGSPGPDGTISPMLAQIHQMEQQIQQLQQHLKAANAKVDDKLEKLKAAGLSTIDLAEQLAQARGRVSELEDQLDALLGQNGVILRVQKRLANIHCPDCHEPFNANEVVRFRIRKDAAGMDFEEEGDDKGNEALGTALADLKSKLRTLQAENGALRNASDALHRQIQEKEDGVRRLEAEKEKEKHQHAALRKELATARTRMGGLEGDLRTEKSRIRKLLNDQNDAVKSKDELETRLHQADRDLAEVQSELLRVTKARDAAKAQLEAQELLRGGREDPSSGQLAELQEAMITLRNEKAELVAEKSSLASRLANLERETLRGKAAVSASRNAQRNMRGQLDKQAEELQSLREGLETKAGEIVRLRDERDEILRGVASLHGDLQRVQKEAAALDDEMRQMKGKQGGDLEEGRGSVRLRRELQQARRDLARSVKEREDHVCSGDPRALSEAEDRHSREAKGLLLRIRYLKVIFTRESLFRSDLALQKTWLADRLEDAENRNTSIQSVLTKYGLPFSVTGADLTLRPTEKTFKAVAIAVRCLCRMRIFARKMQQEEKVKAALRRAYAQTRGKDLVETS